MDDVLFEGAFFKKKKDPCLFGAKIADTETEKQKKNETSRTALHPSLKTVFFCLFHQQQIEPFSDLADGVPRTRSAWNTRTLSATDGP